MKIIHYAFHNDGRQWWRWRIDAENGDTICQSRGKHKLREDSQRELNDVLDFLEEWSRERVQWGGV